MARVLVTGGCGFVGRNLVVELARRGHEVAIIDDESLGSRGDVDAAGVEFQAGDIRDAAAVDRAVAGADAVVHLAADTRVIDSLRDPRHNFSVNVVGTFTVLEALRRHGVGRIVNASTGGAILGDVPPPVDESIVARPISPYGASKLAGEGYMSAYEGGFGLRPITFRFSNVYGPGSLHKGSVVAAFFKRVLAGEAIPVYGDGTQTRDFIFVGDLTSALAGALEHDVTGVYQLGSGRGTSVNELLATMSDVVGEDLCARVERHPARRGEIRHSHCDITLARRTLGFDPHTDLRDGLTETWRWFKSRAAVPA